MKEQLRTWAKQLLSFLEQPVPPDVEVCEFNCRKQECSQSEWETCERRQNRSSSTAYVSRTSN